MSYIFMKILERRPASYDAGITRYAAGDFTQVRERMLSLVKPGDRVLDVGCGPGTFAVECAKRGAYVEAIDIDPQMLYTGHLAAEKAGMGDRIRFRQAPAADLDVERGAFDLVVFSLSMSELREVEQWVALNSAFECLTPAGKLVIADEVVPRGFTSRVRYHVRRLPLLGLTYLVTRTKTRPVSELEQKVSACGFGVERAESFERDSLKFVVGRRLEQRPEPQVLSPDRLPRWLEIAGWLFSYLTLAFKSVPIRTGLYRFGNPSKDAPVLVTANYLLTFAAVRKLLRGLDCYLLVIDTRGINVWCSAGEGNFSAEEIRASLRATRTGDVVDTRRLILPKLAANGVRYREVKRLTGWDAVFGPVYARDIPEYLGNGLAQAEHMKRVRFGFNERLWTSLPFALFVAFWFFLPLVFFRSFYSPMIPAIAFTAAMVYPLAFPILPSNEFFKKGLVLGLLGAAGAALYFLAVGAPAREIAHWALIIVGLTLFVGMDYSGMSAVSNYSKIKREYYVVAPLLGLIIIGLIAVRFLWR